MRPGRLVRVRYSNNQYGTVLHKSGIRTSGHFGLTAHHSMDFYHTSIMMRWLLKLSWRAGQQLPILIVAIIIVSYISSKQGIIIISAEPRVMIRSIFADYNYKI